MQEEGTEYVTPVEIEKFDDGTYWIEKETIIGLTDDSYYYVYIGGKRERLILALDPTCAKSYDLLAYSLRY